MKKSLRQKTGFPSRSGNPKGRFILFGFVAVIAVCVFATSYRATKPNQPQTPLAKPSFGQFPAYTVAEGELEKMLASKDESIDLALANWLVVADIPQFAGVTREAYFKILDGMVEEVRRDMARRKEVAISKGKNPNDPDVRCSVFCGSVVALGFDYAEDFRQHDLTPQRLQALHGDGDKVFLAGLLRSRRGSCVSMPLIYLVIGQRLGFPVHLVAIGKHYFIRWQEPGYRMNIETTIVDRVAVTPDDSVYIQDEGLTRDKLRGSDLRNLSNQEVLGQLLFTRSAYWVMSGERSKTRSWADLSRAFHLAPDDPAIVKTHQTIFSREGITPSDTLLTLLEKERNSLRPEPLDALPPDVLLSLLSPQPTSLEPPPSPRPISQSIPVRATPQSIHQIQQLQIQQVLGTSK